MSFSNTITLKYPINIGKIIPRSTKVQSTFSCQTITTHNVEAFSSVKFACSQNTKKLKGKEYRYYAYRAVAKLPVDSHDVGKIRFNNDYNKHGDMYHITLELLPPDETEAPEEESESSEEESE